MKNIILAIALAVAVLTVTPGCKNVQTTSLNTVNAQPVTVESSLSTWNDWIKNHPNKVTLLQDAQVRAAFQHWKQAQLAVIQIGAALVSTNTPTDHKGQLESNLVGAVDASVSLAKALTNLIASFTK